MGRGEDLRVLTNAPEKAMSFLFRMLSDDVHFAQRPCLCCASSSLRMTPGQGRESVSSVSTGRLFLFAFITRQGGD